MLTLTKGETAVSWFQETPAPSLELMALIARHTRFRDHRYRGRCVAPRRQPRFPRL